MKLQGEQESCPVCGCKVFRIVKMPVNGWAQCVECDYVLTSGDYIYDKTIYD
jgi:ribosomal protein L37AE/L43A